MIFCQTLPLIVLLVVIKNVNALGKDSIDIYIKVKF